MNEQTEAQWRAEQDARTIADAVADGTAQPPTSRVRRPYGRED